MVKSNYTEPPDYQANPEEFKQFMRDVYNHIYGLSGGGTTGLDSDNVDFTDAQNRANHTGTQTASTISDFSAQVLSTHDGISGNHSELTQSAALADLDALATTETADATYDSNEQDMLNNIKTDLTSIRSKINTLLANHRTAKLQET